MKIASRSFPPSFPVIIFVSPLLLFPPETKNLLCLCPQSLFRCGKMKRLFKQFAGKTLLFLFSSPAGASIFSRGEIRPIKGQFRKKKKKFPTVSREFFPAGLIVFLVKRGLFGQTYTHTTCGENILLEKSKEKIDRGKKFLFGFSHIYKPDIACEEEKVMVLQAGDGFLISTCAKVEKIFFSLSLSIFHGLAGC